MPLYKVIIKTASVPFNGTPVSDIEIKVPADNLEAAQAKAKTSAEYYAKYAGKNIPTPEFVVSEVSS